MPNRETLTRVADELTALREKIEIIDHAQDALLQNSVFLRDQIARLSDLLHRMVQLLNPEGAAEDEPGLSDLIARFIAQQSAMIALQRRTLEILARLDPAIAGAEPTATAEDCGA